MQITKAFTFDDVLLKPLYSEVIPAQVDTTSKLTKNIIMKMPIVSAAMDTVTEASMAIAMAQNGGIGILHKNLPRQQQAQSVLRVKRHEGGMVVNPITLSPDTKLSEAKKIMQDMSISGFPVTLNTGNGSHGKLIGVLTNRDIRFAKDRQQPISNLMTKDNIITVKNGVSTTEVQVLCHKHRIERVIVVDDDFNCTGLITVKDIENAKKYPDACKDKDARLRVGAAVGVGGEEQDRVRLCYEAGVDVIVVDTAHGHSKAVIEQIKWIKKNFVNLEVIGGNIATFEGAKALCEAGVDGVKVGIGPGSICTTRIVAGVGVPQISAIAWVVKACKEYNVPVIADGGLKYSGDIAKAIAAGASSVMIGSLLAGSDEAPGVVFYYEGRSYKSYCGMGSIPAMARGSADRYSQGTISDIMKLVPEGIEARVPYKGKVGEILYQLVGGLRSSMGYVGAENINKFWQKAEFIQITSAGLKESHVHDVAITRESPNYPNK